MASRIQKITLLPSFVMFTISILFAVVSFIVVDFYLKQGLLILTSSLFVGGLSYSAYWGYSWILGLVFFGSRVDEFIGLRMGMRVIHYFFLGLTFMLVGLISVMHRLRSCPQYFGYLGSMYRKEIGIPVKCFRCGLKKDCIMTDNRSRILIN